MSRRTLVRVTMILLTAIVEVMTVEAAPFVEMVHPPMLKRGEKNRVALRGTELEQSLGIWCSSPVAEWRGQPVGASSSTEVILEIDVPPNSPLGLYGLRLVTRSGFSNVALIAVDELPVVIRPDANRSEQFQMTVPSNAIATCRPAETDRFAIDVASGQTLSFEVIGSRFGKDIDPLVTIRDASGRMIARKDNDPGLFFDCRFAHLFETAGRYVIEVRDARFDGGELWNYSLRVGDFPAAGSAVPSAVLGGREVKLALPETGDRAVTIQAQAGVSGESFFQDVRFASGSAPVWLPLMISSLENQFEVEPNDNNAMATLVTVPASLNGVLSRRGDQDGFQFELKKGQSLNFEAVAREAGSAADIELVLFDTTGREVRRHDEVTQQRDGVTTVQEARFDFSAGQDGRHTLLVRDLVGDGGPSFTYRIEVTEPQPMLALFADYSSFTVPQRNWQPLPISVTRTRISGPVELELIGAPTGVTLEPRVIPTDSSEIVCRLIASDQAAIGVSTLQIKGRCRSDDGKLSAEDLVRVAPMIDRQLRNKDRIPYALRDNQLRLPPSVTNRLAVQITEPAPFDVRTPFEELLVTKYQDTEFPVETIRAEGFPSPITFSASGGQIGVQEEERDNIYLQIPNATAAEKSVRGTFFNRILTRYEKKRADLLAVSEHNGHTVSLMRSFQLDVRSAFKPQFEPSTVNIEPGKTARIKLMANRTPTYSGAVTLRSQQPVSGVQIPEELVIPQGVSEIEVDISVPAETPPRRTSLRYQSTGIVGRYEEELNEPNLNIDVVKPK